MKTWVYVCLALVVCVTGANPASARTTEPVWNEVDEYIAETMRRLPIAGLSLAIVKGDEILYQQGYGTANAAGDPVTPQTPFMLASVTKTFTALAIRQLAADGRLELDAPLHTYVPEFALGDAQAAAEVTVRHLLEHTSGISQLEGTQPYLHHPGTTFEQALARLARYVPRQAAGEREEYSNWNYVLLGEVVARASGQPYAEYMQANVLDPLAMRHASFAAYDTLPGAATGNLIVFGARVPYHEKHVPVMLSAGYLTASAEDMAHYLVAYFNRGRYQGRPVLPVEGRGWYDALWTWHAGYPSDISTGHAGAHNSVNTTVQLFPRQQIGVVVLMNTRLDSLIPGPTAGELTFNLGRLVMGQPYVLPSNRQFYGGYALVDGMLLLVVVSLGWQAAGLKGWAGRYRSTTPWRRTGAWIGIAIDAALAAGILALPNLLGTRWTSVLYHRLDTAVPILAAALLLAAVGLIKAGLLIRPPAGNPVSTIAARARATLRAH